MGDVRKKRVAVPPPPAERHRVDKDSVDIEARTGDCSICGVGVQVVSHRYATGRYWVCTIANNARVNRNVHPWRAFKGTSCEDCGFVPMHSCQLDVDHVDGQKHNNDPSNFRTLCANCHRLKTWRNRETATRYASFPN